MLSEGGRHVSICSLWPGSAKWVREYGSLVLLSGNRPYQTEVVSVRVLTFIENGNQASAAALASIMLVIALVVIVLLDVLQRRVSRRG